MTVFAIYLFCTCVEMIRIKLFGLAHIDEKLRIVDKKIEKWFI